MIYLKNDTNEQEVFIPKSGDLSAKQHKYVTPGDLEEALSDYQKTLVSGETIKTVNGETLLGSGDLEIQAGIDEAPVDGKQYARQDGNWTEVVSGGGSAEETGTYILYLPKISNTGEIIRPLLQEYKDLNWKELQRFNYDNGNNKPAQITLRAGWLDHRPKPQYLIANVYAFTYQSPFTILYYKDAENYRYKIAFDEHTGDLSTIVPPVVGKDIDDAPSDGKTYGRKDGSWTEVVSGGGGSAEQDSYTVYVPSLNKTTGEVAVPLLQKFIDLNIATFPKIVEANNANKPINITLRQGWIDYGERPQLNDGNAYFVNVSPSAVIFKYEDLWGYKYQISFDITTGAVKLSRVERDLKGDAPADGTVYGRKDNTWVEVPTSGGGSAEGLDTIYYKTSLTDEEIANNEAVFGKLTKNEVIPVKVITDDLGTDRILNTNIYVGFSAMLESKAFCLEYELWDASKDDPFLKGKYYDAIIPQYYGWIWSGKTEIKASSEAGIPDAPADGKTYSRKDGSWVATGTNTLCVDAVAGDAQAAENIRILSLRPRTDVTATIARIIDPETNVPCFYSLDEFNKNKSFIIVSIRGKQVKYNFDKATGVFAKADDLSYTKTEIDNLIGAANNRLETI